MALEMEDARKRKRTSHACDSCRHRKVRCDGRQPCTTCAATGEECAYGTEAIPKSKSDLILDVVLRSETMLREMSAQMNSILPVENRVSSPLALISPLISPAPIDSNQPIANAILSPFHSSTTESILAWPHFTDSHALRQNYRGSVFHLESQRPALQHRASPVLPYLSPADVATVLASFSQNVNFWYPTISCSVLAEIQLHMVSSGHVLSNDHPGGLEDCLALLVMALGCASELVGCVVNVNQDPEMEMEMEMEMQRQMQDERHRWQLVSGLYFDRAFQQIHLAQAECSPIAVQCLFFTALFFAFLQRPLQAWSFISAAAIKCRLLLSYPPADATPEQEECLRRIFWSCYILESDYLAELSALPQTGIADIESSIPLPGAYHTHTSPLTEEQSSLYFLACISMRRLLNRVHDLLYARASGVAADIHQFPSVVAELDLQLEKWRDLLPPPFQFSVDREPAASIEAGFLRQRYLVCKSVIYRPYLTWCLSNPVQHSTQHNQHNHHSGDKPGHTTSNHTGNGHRRNSSSSEVAQIASDGCRTCLEACCLHALNLQGFPQTVMVDTWICSLSMAAVMLIVLAVARERELHRCLPTETNEIGAHLGAQLRLWMQAPGQGVSPSVLQSVRLIEDASRALQLL